MKTYRAERSYPHAGEVQCRVAVVEGWQRQWVVAPLRPAPVEGARQPPAVPFDWGYVGTAPRELARALLADCFGRKWASRAALYQALLDEVVVALGKAAWELTERDLAGWAHAWACRHGEPELAALAEVLYLRTSAQN